MSAQGWIAGCAMLALPSMLRADNLRARFELERPLEGNFGAGQLGRVTIADDVFGQARDFPNDVRIIGRDGTPWPFFLYVPCRTGEARVIDLKILNRTWVEGPAPYLQFEVAIPEVDGKPPVHNQLELVTTGSEFVRRVDILSVDPPQGRMASGYLIEFSNRQDARNRIVRYPDTDRPRLQVRIYPNARSAGETFEISKVCLRRQTENEPEREPVRFVELPVDGRDRNEHAQTRILDVGQTGRPVEFITFAIGNTAYTRCVSIYGRNKDLEAWQWVGGGEIHALEDDRNDRVRLHAACRFLKVQIFHYDDLPLELRAIRLEAVPRYLVFEAATAGGASLCFRGWDINAPRYDLPSRIDKDRLDNLPVAATLDTRPNAIAKIHPWRRYSKLLAGMAVGAVSLLVVWIIVGMIRRQSPADPA